MTAKRVKDARVAEMLANIEGEGGAVTRSQISRIRRGESRPSLETAARLEKLTKIPAARFVMGLAGERDKEREAAA